MSASDETVRADAAAALPSAGGRLKAAREAAGLSIDAVAQQLKLAPRQVKALEEDDWPRLPGRTFIRGFSRNYARFVRIDPEAVLALLPANDAARALERPALAESRRPMGEIPIQRPNSASGARWLILLVIAGTLAAGVIYEIATSRPNLLGAIRSRVSAGSPPHASQATAPSATAGTVTSALPNPVSGDAASSSAAGAAPDSGTTPVVAPAASTAVASTETRSDATPAADAAPAPLVLAFRGSSWVEVKDAHGRVVMQITGAAGMTQSVSASPPLALALGNAAAVDVTYRGQRLDLGPYMRGSVVRVALQ